MNGVKVKKRRQVIYLWGGRGEMGEEKGKRRDSENKEKYTKREEETR